MDLVVVEDKEDVYNISILGHASKVLLRIMREFRFYNLAGILLVMMSMLFKQSTQGSAMFFLRLLKSKQGEAAAVAVAVIERREAMALVGVEEMHQRVQGVRLMESACPLAKIFSMPSMQLQSQSTLHRL